MFLLIHQHSVLWYLSWNALRKPELILYPHLLHANGLHNFFLMCEEIPFLLFLLLFLVCLVNSPHFLDAFCYLSIPGKQNLLVPFLCICLTVQLIPLKRITACLSFLFLF